MRRKMHRIKLKENAGNHIYPWRQLINQLISLAHSVRFHLQQKAHTQMF